MEKKSLGDCVRHATPQVVYTPLSGAGDAKRSESEIDSDPCVRAENEDDDGYDPYSDRTEHEDFFEKDPWR